MKDTEILSRVPLFSLMKNRDLKRIAKLSKHHSYQPEDIIVKEGERDGRLFIIIAGKVEVVKDLGKPQEKTLRIFSTYNYFGEMALIDDYIRSASVVAQTSTELLSIDQWNVREEIRKYPGIAIELMQTLGRRLRAAQESKK